MALVDRHMDMYFWEASFSEDDKRQLSYLVLNVTTLKSKNRDSVKFRPVPDIQSCVYFYISCLNIPLQLCID